MTNSFLMLVFGSLVTWRVSELIVYDSWPADIGVKIRKFAAKSEFWGDLFSCIYCVSIYVSLIVAAYAYYAGFIEGAWFLPYWWSLAGGSVAIFRALPGRE